MKREKTKANVRRDASKRSGASTRRIGPGARSAPCVRPAPTPVDLDMMGRALVLAEFAAKIGEVPIGAVVYETATGRVLGEGANTRETARDPLGHAEIGAIARAARAVGDWRLNHCTLIVTLEPCPMCAGAIVNARVGRVVFGAHDPKAGAIETLYTLATDPRLNHRAEVLSGVCGDESAALLRRFFARVRRRGSGAAAKQRG